MEDRGPRMLAADSVVLEDYHRHSNLCDEPPTGTPNAVESELELAFKAHHAKRTDSIDRRLDESAKFYIAVGELHEVIDDNKSLSSEDEDYTTTTNLEITAPPPLLPENAPQTFDYKGIPATDITHSGIDRGNYSQLHRKAWLEVSDKHHRYGKNLRLYYRHWESLGYPTNRFFTWLDETSPLPEIPECPRSALDTDTVLYITDHRVTQNYVLTIENGHVRDLLGNLVQTGPDGWIFVLRDGVLYGGPKILSVSDSAKQRFHHSSFFGGKAVAAAGILITNEAGKLTNVLPHSGHYRPGEAALQRTLYYLHNEGVDLSEIQVDTQQLIHVCRQHKTKKMDSLHLKSGVQVADYLSHKARCIAEGVFDAITAL